MHSSRDDSLLSVAAAFLTSNWTICQCRHVASGARIRPVKGGRREGHGIDETAAELTGHHPTVRSTHEFGALSTRQPSGIEPVAGDGSVARLLMPHEPVAIDAGPGSGPPAWMSSDGWRLLARPRPVGGSGEVLARFTADSGSVFTAVHDPDAATVRVPFDLDEAYGYYVSEAWRGHTSVHALTAGQLRVYYRLKRFFPRSWLLAARRAFVRRTGMPAFPDWPLDDSVVRLLRFYALCLLAAADATEAGFRWFWPHDYRAALVLTHDVETAAGLRLAVEIADLEEERGFRSSFNVVGADYAVDRGILRELGERGFEIGVHGLRHDRSLFSSRAEFERQLPRIARKVDELGADGFRSPATHRVVEWLAELPVSYDCTMFHSDPYEPQPGGCCTLWPFLLGDVVELPYTVPQDHTLFTLLRRRSVDTWLEQVAAIEERFGLVQCLSHPDPGYLGDAGKRALYVELLDALAERPLLWRALPREVAAWWRRRAEARPSDVELGAGTMRRVGAEVVFEPPPLLHGG